MSSSLESVAPRRRLPRLPLPAKLLVSYLVVLGIGAVPLFLYVQTKLQSDLIALTETQLTEGVRRAAAGLLSFDDDDSLKGRTRNIASVLRHRVTLIAPSGEVLFDSEALTHDNHLSRPEVQAALLGRPLLDVSTARRLSTSTQKDTLYAATRVSIDGPVLRLGEAVDDVGAVAAALKAFARNVQAVAISIAFGFSLLAAVLFLRPLQRLSSTAKVFATGDLSARSANLADDEVGDVARALDAMAVDLRRRLASAGSGDALLAQLVDALPVPCVIVEPGPEGKQEVIALNGPARRALRVEGQSARRKVQELVGTGRFRRALDEAEADGDPEPCMLYVDDNVRFEALVHVLKRPGAAPLTVILGHEAPSQTSTTLPPPTTVTPRAFEAVLREAKERARPSLGGVMIEVDDSPGVLVADVDGRCGHALALAFEAAAKALAGKGDILAVDVHVEPTRVRLALEALVPRDLESAVRPVIAPLGGDIAVDDHAVRVWLPRA
jgi:HAMP domain-containing protein